MSRPFAHHREQARQEFQSRGFLLLRGVLSQDGVDLASPVLLAYREWLPALFAHLSSGLFASDSVAREALRKEFDGSDPGRRLAMTLGVAGRALFDHLSPAVNLRLPGYRYRADLPRFERAAWYRLATAAALHRLLSPLLGAHQVLGPRIQPVFCLHGSEWECMDRLALRSPGIRFENQSLLSSHVGNTPWSMSCWQGPLAAINTEAVDVVLPLTAMNVEAGTLWILPASHRFGIRRQPLREELRQRMAVTLEAGDVLVLHNRLFVSQTRSRIAGCCAVWLSLQFHRAGIDSGYRRLPTLMIDDAGPATGLPDWIDAWESALPRLDGRCLTTIRQT